MDWFALFQNLGIFSIASGLIVWLIKQFFKQSFAKDLEKFKADLSKEAIQFRVRYEKLHSERAEVIKEVYKRISRTYRAFRSYMCPLQLAGEPSEEEKGKKAADEVNALIDYYEENKIFFEKEIAKEIDNLLQKFREAWNQFDYSKYKTEGKHRDVKEWNKAWKNISEETPKIKELIENRFREIIGIEESIKLCQHNEEK